MCWYMKRVVYRLFWLLLCLELLPTRSSRTIQQDTHSLAGVCKAFETLQPPIYEQLAPFMTGIQQKHVDLASKFYQWPGPAPRTADLKYNLTAAQTINPADDSFPWSHPYIVKVVIKDGQAYLPGGRIPPVREGFSFTSQW